MLDHEVRCCRSCCLWRENCVVMGAEPFKPKGPPPPPDRQVDEGRVTLTRKGLVETLTGCPTLVAPNPKLEPVERRGEISH